MSLQSHQSYELVYITRPELDEEANAAALQRYVGVITAQGGTVEAIDKLGKRRLAYEIDGLREGTYAVVTFKGEPAVPAELDRVLKISDGVIRHLIVKKEPPTRRALAAKRASEPAPAAAAGGAAEGDSERRE